MENIYKIVLGGLLLWFCSASGEAQAQTTGLKLGSNPGSKDPNAILDLSGTTTQGVLLPRISLTGTSNSAPLAGTVSSGMLVYNTATAGDVTPGVYFSNGTQWVRVASNGSGGMIQAPSLALTSTTNPTGTTGQVLYNTNAAAGVPVGLVVWNGSAWAPASGSTADGDAWGVTGEDQSSAIGRIGNVGIGTTTPSQKLTISGNGDVLGIDNTASFVAKNSSGNYESFLVPRWNDDVMYLDYGANGFNIRNNSMSPTMFMTNGGNVGIGTETPFTKLELRNGVLQSKQTLDYAVAGSRDLLILGLNKSHGNFGAISSYVWQAEKEANGGSIKLNLLAQAADGTYGSNYDNANVARSNAMTFFNGNIGVGTNSPTANLHVMGTAKLEGTATNSGYLEFARSGQASRDGYLGYGNNGGIDFVSEVGSKPITILTNNGNILLGPGTGNVGIGTTTPAAKLDINGSTNLRGLITTSEAIELGGLGSGDRFSFIDFHSQDGQDYNARIVREPGANGVFNIINGSSLLTLNTAGNIGIGTSSPTAKLEVAGNARIQTLPAGSGTDDVVTTDANGNLRKMPASTFTGATGPQGPAGPQGATGPAGSNATADGDAWAVTGEDQTSAIGRIGNVGIGTVSPTHKLHVDGGRLAVGSTAPGTWSTNGSDIFLNTGATNSQIHLRPNGDGSTVNQFATLPSAGHLFFGSDGLEKVRINTAGNVGIGTTNPVTKLDVYNDTQLESTLNSTQYLARFTNNVSNASFLDFFALRHTAGTDWGGTSTRIQRKVDATNMGFIDFGINGAIADKGLGFGSMGTTSMVIQELGNVGIGTTTPADKLTVKGGALALIPSAGNSTTGYAPLLLKNIAGNNVFKIQQEFNTDDGKIFFLTDNADNGATESIRMVIQRSNGNVGIGTSSPTSKLHVDGTFFVNKGSGASVGEGFSSTFNITNSSNNERALTIHGNGSNPTNIAEFYSNNGSFILGFAQDNQGRVGMGTATPTSKLQVSGSFATAINNAASSITLNETHNTLTLDLTSGNATVTLPAANTCGGRIYHIVRTDGSSNVLTFSAAISLGNTTFTTSNIPGATFIIQSDGSNWRLINN